ncbi:MAG TPA: hypothetical protein VK201_02205 [bacterium]|nr:hypothetical protein [bacterium]
MTEAFSAKFIRVIDANRSIKDELAAAIQMQSTRRRISVTDLINPRKAFFSRTHPEVPPSADRAQAMLAGTGFHNEFEHAVSTEEFAEQLVEYEGIVGKIDIYEDLPVELKTTRSLRPGLESIYTQYVDQLGAYAVMTGRMGGHLLLYGRGEFGRPPELRAFQVEFTDLPGIGTEMLRRRDLLRHALETGDPTGLPRCMWLGRCEYQELCGCESAPEIGPLVGASSVSIHPDEQLETLFAGRLQMGKEQLSGFRFYHLAFPRKAAFGLLDDGDDAAPTTQDRLGQLNRRGFFRALDDVLYRGMPGAFTSVPVRVGKLADRVRLCRGVPTILKSSKARDFIERKRLPAERPWNVDTLAFQCALLGAETGRLVLYYEVIPENKFMVYDVMFSDLPAVRAELERRLHLLESGAPPAELPACPAWMAKNCPYRDRCGCGDAA